MVKILGPESFGRVAAPSPVAPAAPTQGAGIANLGEAISRVGKQLQEERQQADDVAFFSYVAENKHNTFQGVYDSHKGMASEGQESFSEFLPSKLSEAEDQLFKGAEENGFRPSANARQRIQLQLANDRGQFMAKAVAEENNIRVNRALEQPTNLTRQASMDAFNDPSTYKTRIADTQSVIEEYASILPADKVAELRQKSPSAIAMSAVKGMINQSPAQALARLTANEFDQYLTVDQKDTLLSQATSASRAVVAKAQTQSKQFIRDELTAISRTGERAGAISDEQIIELFPENANEILSEFRDAEQFYNIQKSVELSSVDDDRAIVESIKPAGAGFESEAKKQDDIIKALRDKYTMLGIGTEKPGDPVKYITDRDPELHDALNSNDPIVVQSALDRLSDMQERLSVPLGRRRVMSKREAIGVAASVIAAPAADRAGMILGLEEKYGPYYQNVHNELVAGGLDPESAVLSSVIDDPITSQKIATLMEMGPKDIVAGMEKTEVSDIKAQVFDAMADFTESFEAGDFTGAASKEISKYHGVIEKLALLNFRQTGDMSKSVEDATNKILYDRYSVLNSGNAPQGRGIKAYIPKVIQGIDINPARVETVADERQTRAALVAFDPAPIGSPNTQDFVNRERMISTAVNSGFWVTSPDGMGMELMVPFVGGGALPIVDKNGAKYRINFVDAMNPDTKLKTQLRERGLSRVSGAL